MVRFDDLRRARDGRGDERVTDEILEAAFRRRATTARHLQRTLKALQPDLSDDVIDVTWEIYAGVAGISSATPGGAPATQLTVDESGELPATSSSARRARAVAPEVDPVSVAEAEVLPERESESESEAAPPEPVAPEPALEAEAEAETPGPRASTHRTGNRRASTSAATAAPPAAPAPPDAPPPLDGEPTDPGDSEEAFLAARIAVLEARDGEIELTPVAEGERLRLGWHPGAPGSRYLVVVGPTAPMLPGEASVAALTTASTLEIARPEHPFIAVFAYTADGEGITGRRHAIARIPEEVYDLSALAFPTHVQMTWRTPRDHEVEFFRSEPDRPLPTRPSGELSLQPPLDGQFRDDSLVPGEMHEYLIRTVVTVSGRTYRSAGQVTRIGIPAMSSPVRGLRVTRATRGGVPGAEVRWHYSGTQTVRLFMKAGAPDALSAGEEHEGTAAELEELIGAPYVEGFTTYDDGSVGPDFITFERDWDHSALTFTIVAVDTMSGSERLRVLDYRAIAVPPRVEGLELVERTDFQLLRLTWPPRAQMLGVWVTAGETSTAPAGRPPRIVARDEYDKYGGVIFSRTGVLNSDRLPVGRSTVHVAAGINIDGEQGFGASSSVVYTGRWVLSWRYRARRPAAPPQQGLFGRRAAPPEEPDYIEIRQDQEPTERRWGPVRVQLKHHSQSFPMRSDYAPLTGAESLLLQTELAGGQYPSGHYSVVPVPIPYPAPRTGVRLFATNPEFIVLDPPDLPAPLPAPLLIPPRRGPAAWEADLPGSWGRASQLRVILVGSTESGKTTYLQVLLSHLLRSVAPSIGAPMLPLDPTGEGLLEQARTFVDHRVLPPPTDPFARNEDVLLPGVFSLGTGTDRRGRALALFDVAGEDMQRADTARPYAENLVDADAIVLLIDPKSITAVKAMLDLREDENERVVSAETVLSNVIDVMRSELADRGIDPNSSLGNIAVVFSKFDALLEANSRAGGVVANLVPAGSALNRDPHLVSNELYNPVDGYRVDQETRALLGYLGGSTFISEVERNFANARYFVMSALGHDPAGSSIEDGGVTPLRAGDPLRWIMSSAGWGS